MNANLKPQTPAIEAWLSHATNQLTDVNIPSARLDSEVLLAFALKKDRSYLHAHPEQYICSKSLKIANSYLKKRQKRMPVAYIIGQKEFYGRNFMVTPDTLIPRPESEAIIEIIGELLSEGASHHLLDVGTGSGCLGITAKLELPSLNVTLMDISPKALQVAKMNARGIGASVDTLQSDLLANCHSKADIIVANLPYVDKKWECSPETSFEPSLALFADDNGELLIKKLIDDTYRCLNNGGFLIIESDPRQHQSLISYAKTRSLILSKQFGYAMAFKLATK